MSDNQQPDGSLEERRDYQRDELRSSNLQSNPFAQFEVWLQQARDAALIDATAMVLSTVDAGGKPHSRVVLLKAFGEDGLTFYTNYQSNKGEELAANKSACILFYWRELERQVRIEGIVQKHSSKDADDYFQSRPEGSRYSAAASRQSQPVDNRGVLEAAVEILQQQYPDGSVPRPDHWGGYLLKPDYFEFWQGRSDRLHDRFCYQSLDAEWNIQRLSP